MICLNLNVFKEALSDISKIKITSKNIILWFHGSYTIGGNNPSNLESLIIKFPSMSVASSKPPKWGGLMISSYNPFIGTCKYSLITLTFSSYQ